MRPHSTRKLSPWRGTTHRTDGVARGDGCLFDRVGLLVVENSSVTVACWPREGGGKKGDRGIEMCS